jgi:hypothetical protein
MTSIRTILIVAIAAVIATACGPKGPRKPSPEEMLAADPLPLAPGAAWRYRATVKQYDPEKKEDVTRSTEWTTSVIDAKPIESVVAYRIKGWPTDLVGFEAGTSPVATEKVLIRSGDSFMWATTPEGTVDGAEGWFTWPLLDGQQVCPNPELVYCWTVATTEDGYRLTYRTGPDEESYLIQPGTGVAEYTYLHHGTTLEVRASLVEYKEGTKLATTAPPPAAK